MSANKDLYHYKECSNKKTKLTLGLMQTMEQLIRCGSSIKFACSVVGISTETHKKWMKTALHQPKSPHGEYRSRIKQAYLDFSVEALNGIKLCGKRDWRALSYLLAKRDPEHWAEGEVQEKAIRENEEFMAANTAVQSTEELVQQLFSDPSFIKAFEEAKTKVKYEEQVEGMEKDLEEDLQEEE